MAWILTQSTTLPSPVVSVSTDDSIPPTGAFIVDPVIAAQAVGNPAGYILNSTTQTVIGKNDIPYEETVYSLSDAPLSIDRAKLLQRDIIKQAFAEAANAPVTDASGITWEGSKESGTSIFLGCQLAQQAGATTITVFDLSKTPHQMTIAEGMTVAALIGMQYQTVLAKKNALYAQIDSATTVAAVQAIVW